MKHKMSYPRGMFRRLYDRDANNLMSHLLTNVEFCNELMFFQMSNESYKELLFFKQDWI